ncbi:Ig-like domain repeat protein [Streptomyces mirabilis]|uniref:Ig-like domain repeat protein n=1 Tax=Streptomyces mirabilis TaxID=68239 RepID=UPI0036DD0BF9
MLDDHYGDGEVRVVDAASNQSIDHIHVGGSPTALVVTPDGKRVYVTGTAVGGNVDNVSVIDTATDKVTDIIPLREVPSQEAASPDGAHVYVNLASAVAVIDTKNNKVDATIPVPAGGNPTSVAVTPDSSQVWVGWISNNSHVVSVFDANNHYKLIQTVPLPGSSFTPSIPTSIAFAGHDAYVTDSANDAVDVVDAGNDYKIDVVPVGNQPGAVAVTPDGFYAYIANSGGDSVSLLETASNKVTGKIHVSSGPTAVAFSNANAYVLSPYPYSNVSVIDTATRSVAATFPGGVGAVDVAAGTTVPASTTTMTASPNPADAGQQVTLTAAVKGSGGGGSGSVDGGTVTFYDGIGNATTLGSAPVSNGKATLTTSSLDVGTHTLTAQYSGNADYGPSNSATLDETVRTDTTTALASSPNPSAFRQPVLLTATVTPAASGCPPRPRHPHRPAAKAVYTADRSRTSPAATRTTVHLAAGHPRPKKPASALHARRSSSCSPAPSEGTVTFYDGTTALGPPVAVTDGQATLTTTTLTLGTHTITAQYNGTAHYGNSTSNPVIQAVQGPAPGNAAYLVSDSTLSRIDTQTNTLVSTIRLTDPYEVAVTSDGRTAYVSQPSHGTVSVIDTATNAVTHTITVGNQPTGLAVTPNGAYVYVANSNSSFVSVIDTHTRQVTDVTVGGPSAAVAVSPDGAKAWVAVGAQQEGSVVTIDTASNTLIGNPISGLGGNIPSVAVSPDSQTVYVLDADDDAVVVINAKTRNITKTVQLPLGTPQYMALSPNGQQLSITQPELPSSSHTPRRLRSRRGVAFQGPGVTAHPSRRRIRAVASTSPGASSRSTSRPGIAISEGHYTILSTSSFYPLTNPQTLISPAGIADNGSNLYIAENSVGASSSVVVFNDVSGAYIGTIPAPTDYAFRVTPFTTLPTTKTSLTSSASPATVGQQITLTATVTPTDQSTPGNGTVTFYESPLPNPSSETVVTLGTVPVTAGQATLTITPPIAGSVLTAQYSGSTTYGPSTSPSLTQYVTLAPGPYAYVPNWGDGSLSAINRTTGTVTTIPIPPEYGKFAGKLVTYEPRPNGVAVTPDGSQVYIAEGGNLPQTEVSVYNTRTGTFTSIPIEGGGRGDNCDAVAVTPDGSKTYAVCDNVAVINTADNTVITQINGFTGDQSTPDAVSITSDGSTAYVADYGTATSQNGGVSVINTANNTIVKTYTIDDAKPTGVAVTPDGAQVYVTAGDYVQVINTSTGNITTISKGIDLFTGTVAISPNGAYAYVTNVPRGKVYVIDTSDNTVTDTISVQDPTAVAVTPDNSQAWVVGNDTASVIADNDHIEATYPTGSTPKAVAFGTVIRSPRPQPHPGHHHTGHHHHQGSGRVMGVS